MGEQPRGTKGDLDALLDEALEDFGNAVSAAQTSSTLDAPEAAPAAGSTANQETKSKSLAFDPLRPRPGTSGASQRTRQPPSASANPASKGHEGGDEELDQVSAGISRLLAELAQADIAGGRSSNAAQDGQHHMPGMSLPAETPSGAVPGTDGGLSATLQALAEQIPEMRAHAGEPNEIDDELLRKLEEFKNMDFSGVEDVGVAGTSGGAGGLTDLPGMSSFIDTIMHQLLSKEVLYQPMKDIGARYPSWLEANRETLSSEDYRRYEEQYGYIQQIVSIYETEPENYTQLVEVLQEMQQRGQPPQEIIDELAPGMSFGPNGMPNFEAGSGPPGMPDDCVVQ